MITVKLYAHLRNGRGKMVGLVHSEGMTVGQIIKQLDIEAEEVQMVLIAGKRKNFNQVLEDQTVISLFPPIAGG